MSLMTGKLKSNSCKLTAPVAKNTNGSATTEAPKSCQRLLPQSNQNATAVTEIRQITNWLIQKKSLLKKNTKENKPSPRIIYDSPIKLIEPSTP